MQKNYLSLLKVEMLNFYYVKNLPKKKLKRTFLFLYNSITLLQAQKEKYG